jgi:signal transduction histidine kinase
LAGDALDVVRLPPDTFPRLVSDELADQPFLFDLRRHKILVLRRGRRVRLTDTEPIDHAFAARYHIEAGLAFPIAIEDYRGQLFALGVPGLCSDDLKAASGVAQAISSAFERTALFFATEEAAATRARLRLARDLHDSVAQFFAGMALKLHALTKNSVLEPAVRRELEELQQELAREQRDFRGLLSALRDPEAAGGGAELAEPIRLLVARLERQWSMQCDISFDPPSMRAPASLQHELEQLIREAVANAVRHGEAKRITIAIAEKEGLLELRIADDGNGFPVEGAFADADLRARGVGPRSLHERVQALRGTLALVSDHDTGSVLTLFLPLGGSA